MGDSQPLVREVTILNAEGFHTRPVMRFVDEAQRYQCDIRVTSADNPDEVVNGKSAMELMLLGATQGTKLRIHAEGADASQALDGLQKLVQNRFGIQQSPPKP